MSRVAVVGGSGFIGNAVARAMHDSGRAVTIFDLVPPASSDPCDFSFLDLTRVDEHEPALGRFSEVVIAAGVLAKGCVEDPKAAWEVNVSGTIRLLERLARPEVRPRRRVSVGPV